MVDITQLQSPPADHSEVGPPRINPIKLWAGLGVLIAGLTAYSVTRWLVGGHARPAATGPSGEIPGWMLLSVRLNEIAYFGLAAVAIYIAIIRPWRRDRRLTADGVVLIGIMSMWIVQDPLMNYFQIGMVYNAHTVDLGCPQCYMPGWFSDSGQMAESAGWAMVWYIGFAFLAIKASSMVVQKYRLRNRSNSGWIRIVLTLVIAGVIFETVTEVLWMRQGLYAYPSAGGAPDWLVLFKGHYYQYPLYFAPIGGLFYVALTLLHCWRDDRGQLIFEKGLADTRGTLRESNTLRVLASVGVFNLALFASFNGFAALFPLHWNDWPDDIEERSYFRQELCGEGTTVACPENHLPIPRETSVRIGPDGDLIRADGRPVDLDEDVQSNPPEDTEGDSPRVHLVAAIALLIVWVAGGRYVYRAGRSAKATSSSESPNRL